jgi:drug/metabolite transporter (DMT)-like permease
MSPILIALLAPALWAAGNHIDKYLVDRRMTDAGVGAALVFSALVGVPMAVVFWLLHPAVTAMRPDHAALLTFNGALYVISLWPYLLALQRDDAAVVVPLFQLTVVFSYALGLIFLGEQLTLLEAGASALIIAGSLLLTVHWRAGMRLKHDLLLLMVAAAFMNALNWFLFKFVAIQEDFFVSSFWEYTGFGMAAAGLLLIPVCRREFFRVLGTNSRQVIGLAGANEILALGAKIATNVASLALPLAVISTIHSLQAPFVLFFGLILSAVTPRHYLQDNVPANVFLQRMTAIVLIVVGTIGLSLL